MGIVGLGKEDKLGDAIVIEGSGIGMSQMGDVRGREVGFVKIYWFKIRSGGRGDRAGYLQCKKCFILFMFKKLNFKRNGILIFIINLIKNKVFRWYLKG